MTPSVLSLYCLYAIQCTQKNTNCQKFDPKIKRDNQKNSYERRDYESLDILSLFFYIEKL